MKIAVIGAGISGLAIAHILKQKHEVIVFEADARPGGLIKCDYVDHSLFHRTGGHVFNTKRKDVADWFWQHFDREKEFTKALRNSVIAMPDGKEIPYPIENHLYLLDENTQKCVIDDLLHMSSSAAEPPHNFEEFLRKRFGDTLYRLYFHPYNTKIWRRPLNKVPLEWLEGKLPMPTAAEIVYNNINHVKEQTFVHSSFYYPRQGGSQFIADRLSQGLNIRYNSAVNRLEQNKGKWIINEETFDKVVFCGNIKQLPTMLNGHTAIRLYADRIDRLESHGTTTVFCEISPNPYSWTYLPDGQHASHRIICTGNFSPANSSPVSNHPTERLTASIEFTDRIEKEEILENLAKMPYCPRYLTHHYEQYTYPIQDKDTKAAIASLKNELRQAGIYLLGRFAEWEYYNMDVAIGAALDMEKEFA